MKLNKTEQKIMDELAISHNGRMSFSYGYITSRRQMGYGSRTHAAVCKLRDKGLIKIVASQSHSDTMIHRFGSHHWTEVLVEVVK